MPELFCAVCLALQIAINSGDVDRGASYFAPGAVVIQPRIGGMPQVYVGRDQIRWWLARMSAEHARIEPLDEPELSRGHVRWSESLSLDVFRNVGVERVDLDADVVLSHDELIDSLTTVLTPDSARDLLGSLD